MTRVQTGMSRSPPTRSAGKAHLREPSEAAPRSRLGLVSWPRTAPSLQFLLPVFLVGSAVAAAAPPDRQPVEYVVVVTGSELLSGIYPDSHTHYITRTLRPLGLRCVGSMSVDDKSDDIQEALRFALTKVSLVIVTGGLGPTDNDVTRNVLSQFTGIALREDPALIKHIERHFKVPREQLRRNLRRQFHVPTGGKYFTNPNGTAVGLVFEFESSVIVALPGPPRELQPMVRDDLVPYLNGKFGTRLPGSSLTLRFVGIGQSRIDQTLKDHVSLPPEITLTSQFKSGRVDFTFSRPDDTLQDRAQLDELKQQILRHLGEYVYADDKTSLEGHAVNLLSSRGTTLALAEAGSGGHLAAGITTAADAKRVLAGAYVAANEEKLRRLLRVPDAKWTTTASSTERIKLIATAAAELSGSQWALAVGDPQRDETGARYVEVVFKTQDGLSESQRIALGSHSPSARGMLTTQILDQLRRRLR